MQLLYTLSVTTNRGGVMPSELPPDAKNSGAELFAQRAMSQATTIAAALLDWCTPLRKPALDEELYFPPDTSPSFHLLHQRASGPRALVALLDAAVRELTADHETPWCVSFLDTALCIPRVGRRWVGVML